MRAVSSMGKRRAMAAAARRRSRSRLESPPASFLATSLQDQRRHDLRQPLVRVYFDPFLESEQVQSGPERT